MCMRGLASLLVIAFLVGACQTETTQNDQQMKPQLPEDELTIEDPWVEPAAQGESTTLYMTIANGRASADTLIGARAPIFENAQIHAPSSDTEEMAESTSREWVSIPAQTRLILAPDTTYIRLTSLNQALDEDATLLVTLEFSQSGLQQVRAPVQSMAPSNDP